jgi:hypothetical protein
VRFDFSVLCYLPPVHTGWESSCVSRRVNLPGLQAPPRKRLGAQVLQFESAALLAEINGRCAAGAATGLESPRGVIPREIDTSTFRSPGTSQLVEGAALIQRYRQVRFLGARPPPSNAPLA